MLLNTLCIAQTSLNPAITSSNLTSKNVNVFTYCGVFGDTVVHLLWENVANEKIQEIILESSNDGINFSHLSEASVSSLADIHADKYPKNIDYFNKILLSSEHGNNRFIFNDVVKEINISTNPKWYRVQMISQSGNVFTSQIFGTTENKSEIANSNSIPTSNDGSESGTMKSGPKAGCTPLGTPTPGYNATLTTQTFYGDCCYWIETLYTSTGPVMTNCGGNSYAWCCSNVPEAPGCPSGFASDPCCVHYCNDYYGCSCQPWQCCTSNLVSEWVVTTSTMLTPITLTEIIQDETCLGLNDGSISLSVNNGTPAFSYIWSNGATTSSITGLSSGTYYVTVSDAHNCQVFGTYTINQGQGITVVTSPDQSVCPGTSAVLTASGGSTYLWSDGSTGPIISVTPAVTTIYTVTATSTIGCTATATTTVTLFPDPIVLINSSVVNFCNGQTAVLTAYCNVPGSSYLWDNGQNTNVRTVSPTQTTNYYMSCTTPDGCIGTSIITVNVLPNPVLTLNPSSQAICYGSSTTVSVLSNLMGTTYLWNTGDITNTITVSPTTNTTYTVTGTSIYGCTTTSTVSITVLPLPLANAGLDQTICFGNTATLIASGGISYLWSNGNSSPLITVSPNNTSIYTVTVTDNNGCSATDNVTVFINPLPIADAGTAQIICTGQSANLTGFGGTSFLWSNGLTNQSINVSPTINTTYTLTVTDINGCTASDNVAITVNPLPTANAGIDQSICMGSFATLSATGGLYYQWNNNGGNTQTINVNPMSTTNYNVTVTDQNGCSASDQVVVTVNPLPNANAGIDQTICNGNSASLTASGGVSYLWNNGLMSPFINVSPITSTIYIVTVTDMNGCSASDQVIVNVNPLPFANAGTDQIVCQGGTIYLAASGGIYYAWSNGLGNNQGVTANPTVTTTYIVTVTDANGCSASDNVTVNVNPLPPANAGPDQTICNGSSATLVASGGISFNWNNGYTTQSITVSPIITTSYSVVVTDINGCSALDNVNVNVNQPPIIQMTPESPTLCQGQSILLSAFGASSYQWSPTLFLSSGSGSSVTANPTNTITYTVVGTDNYGCVGSNSITITVNPVPISNFVSEIIEVCQNAPVQFTNYSSPDAQYYYWDFGDPASGGDNTSALENPTHSFIGSGTFDVTLQVSNSYGCAASITYPNMLTVHAKPEADFNMNSTIVSIDNPRIYFFDNSSNAIEWLWNFGDPNSGPNNIATTSTTSHEYLANGEYDILLSVKSSFGCIDSVIKTVKKESDFTFYIPSAFTPNSDGNNDIFFPLGSGYDPNTFEMFIFDRWGEKLYETNDINQPWNGCKQGHHSPSPIGVYVYMISVAEQNGMKHKYKGTVTIAM